MQDKINHLAANKIKRHYTKKEARQSHIEKWKQSGLSRSKYCRQEGLALSSFSNWSRSNNKPKAKFKPIEISHSPTPQVIPGNVIEIIAEHGIKVRLLNVADASLVINIIRGLIKCN